MEPSGSQQAVAGGEKGVVVVQPHRFEHLNTHQLIEGILQISVVFQ